MNYENVWVVVCDGRMSILFFVNICLNKILETNKNARSSNKFHIFILKFVHKDNIFIFYNKKAVLCENNQLKLILQPKLCMLHKTLFLKLIVNAWGSYKIQYLNLIILLYERKLQIINTIYLQNAIKIVLIFSTNIWKQFLPVCIWYYI